MSRKSFALVLSLGMTIAGTLAFAQPPSPQSSPIPSDSEIRKILADRVGAENLGIGLVVGAIDAKGRRVVTYGSLAKDDKRSLDGDTIFEIGSMTKVFTSLVLMDMARKGEVSVTDPVSKYLPATVKVPERNGKKITLQDLATQSSGLPRMPNNFDPKDPTNPYADYTPERLYAFLSGYELTRDIGSQFEYSNLGVGLLGHALSLRAGVDYEAMVKARVLMPLGMSNTGITLTPAMKARLAVGHGPGLNPVPNWDIAALAGAGALRSSANDMLTFLAANLGYVKTSLAPAMTDEISIRRPAGAPNMEIAYNWLIQTKDGNSIIWHNGGTGGYRTWMGFDLKSRAGIVVLSNFSSAEGPDDIGRHLLDASYPLLKVSMPKKHKEITLDSSIFDKYAGSYQLAPNVIIAVSRQGDQFFVQLTGQGKLPIFAESQNTFFLKAVDAQLTFAMDDHDHATQVVLHQNGRDQTAKRIDERQATALADALAKRVKDQTPAPGSEAAVRRCIEEVRAGQPKYELMSEGLAAVTRQQLPQLTASIVQLGAVQSITFKGVGPGGADIYEVKFEHGSTEWRITLEPDGKVAGLGFRPL
jgi:serine-type D-Ala-D-Ala carboxypeptidase/endopeptidase